MDRLAAMHLFVRVAELGSFSAVAQQMGVARSVVTRQIAALEAHLGVRLLHRTTRRVVTTPEGQDYYEKASRVLIDIEEIDTAFSASQRRPNIAATCCTASPRNWR